MLKNSVNRGGHTARASWIDDYLARIIALIRSERNHNEIPTAVHQPRTIRRAPVRVDDFNNRPLVCGTKHRGENLWLKRRFEIYDGNQCRCSLCSDKLPLPSYMTFRRTDPSTGVKFPVFFIWGQLRKHHPIFATKCMRVVYVASAMSASRLLVTITLRFARARAMSLKSSQGHPSRYVIRPRRRRSRKPLSSLHKRKRTLDLPPPKRLSASARVWHDITEARNTALIALTK